MAQRLLSLYPMPNVPGTGFFSNNFISNGILNNDVDQFDIRIDHNLRAGGDQIFGRYSFQNTDRHEPPVLEDPVASGDFSSDILNRGQNFVAGWSRVFGASVFNEFRVGWNKVRSDSVHPAFGVDANSQFGIRGVPSDPRFAGGLPHMPITRFTRLGGPFFRPQFQWSQVFQFANNLTVNRGRHAMKFGLERRRDLVTYIDVRSLNGELNFPDGRYTGFGLGDFLLGLSSSQRVSLFHQPDLYSDGWQVYAQDAWRVLPSLTFNYGVRYEYFTPMFDRNNLLTNIDPATGAVVLARDGSVRERTLIEPDRNDIAPRVSLVWSATPRVVVRAGYGIFYQQSDRYGSESQLGLNLPQLVDVAITANSANDAPAFRFRDGFTPVNAATVNPAVVQWRIQDPNQKTPNVQQFSIGPEVQVGESMVGAIEYVGNRTRNGRRLRNLNEGIIVTPGVGPVVFPYAQYGYGGTYLEQIVTNGRADYNALQTRFSRRMSGGLAFNISYTFSKTLGDYLDHLSVGGGAVGNNPLTAYDMARDYGPLAFDIPHRLVTSFIYELPWGRGRQAQPGGVLGALASDWVVNGILSLNSGRPVHRHHHRPRQHRPGPHRPRQLRRRSGPRGLRPDDRRVVRHHRLPADHGLHLWQLRRELRPRAALEVDEPVGVPLAADRRRAPDGAAHRDVQSLQLGQLRLPGRQRVEPQHVRAHHQHPRRPAGNPAGAEVLLLIERGAAGARARGGASMRKCLLAGAALLAGLLSVRPPSRWRRTPASSAPTRSC